MKNDMEILKKCPLFEGIEEAEITGMLGCLGARRMSVSKGQMIFQEGEAASSVGLVLSGQVQIIMDDYYGNRSIVGNIDPGEIFGESFACANVQSLPVSAVAMEAGEIMLLNCGKILRTCPNACRFHTRLVQNLLQVLAVKNLSLNEKISFTAKRTTREKLMAYLLSQAKKQGSDSFRIPFDRQGLADYLGVERSAMAAELGKLRRDGVIECEKNRFRLL